MKAFFKEKKRSAGYARDRMKLLLISERIDCSPQMMKMLRNDMIHTVKKYLTIDEKQIKIHNFAPHKFTYARYVITIRMDIPMAHRLLFLFAETPDESSRNFSHPGLTSFRLTENP